MEISNTNPINPSSIPPVNPSSGSSNNGYTAGEKALLDAMAAFYADLQAAIKDGSSADLTKLEEDGKKFINLLMAFSSVFPKQVNDPVLLAIQKLGDGTDGSGGDFQDLIAACGANDQGTVQSDFSAILGSQDIQNQIQNSFTTLYQTYPLPHSQYDATQQAMLDLTAFLQQIFNTQPDSNNELVQNGIQLLCQNFSLLETDLQNGNAADVGMYHTFVSNAPALLTKMIQDGSSGNDISGDIQAINNSWSSINAGINAFLNAYPAP